MESKGAGMKHEMVFGLLVVLALFSVGTTFLHLSYVWNNIVIFGTAFLMAGLVVAQYMGLRLEGPMVVILFVIPLVLFAIMVILMMPDIAHVGVDFLRVL
jgi:caa(3)-type oxidase subunit IV